MATQKVLVVEDETPVRQMIAFNLKRAGYEVLEAADVRSARASIADNPPDLVLVDWMLPDSSGLELTRLLRSDDSFSELPVIMLTARAEERDKVLGLDSGADDYITKPFSGGELISRIKAVLRRSSASVENVLCAGHIKIYPESHRVFCADEEIQLGPTEYRLLKYFISHSDRVFSRAQLLDHVWGQNVYVEERTVDVHVQRLRKAVSTCGADAYIQTVRGAGYRFCVTTVEAGNDT
jgi:two-component system, OmpR family, phosphate regulon response regulator PhoB